MKQPHPQPRLTIISSSSESGTPVTAIFRHWRSGEASQCKICSRCTARPVDCLIVIPGVFNVREVETLQVETTAQGWRVKPAEVDPVITSSGLVAEPALDWFRKVMGT